MWKEGWLVPEVESDSMEAVAMLSRETGQSSDRSLES